MSRFTPDELVTLTALVNFHQKSLRQLLGHGELTAAGREQYARDIAQAELLREKLMAEYHEAVRLPEVV
jgi:hypothetical protein